MVNNTEFLFLVWFFRVWYGGPPGNGVFAVLEYNNDDKEFVLLAGLLHFN